MKKIWIGAAYYPEMWDESEIDKDIVRMKELGVNCVRVGEFAWGKMEPREGEFNFDWLKKAVDKCWEAGIATVMCTPTCTPPRWMLDKYEEMRGVDSHGVRAEVSSRCHPCKTSPLMREKNAVIVEELAKAFGAHPGVIGWQIDNEIFPYGEGCFCPLCRKAFRAYLKEKYGTIGNLNEKWGMVRWSLEYKDFDAVMPPRDGQWKHPSLCTEWFRFQCAQVISYVNEQAEIIRKYSSAPIGTDMMRTNLLSYYEMNEQLDVVQYNHYEPADLLPGTAFAYDFLRCVKDKPFWVTETQVGWNGSNFADCGYRPQGACYVNTWQPVAKGAEMNAYWLFRTHPNGHEIAHGALLSTAGRPYRVADEVARAAKEFGRCKTFLTDSFVRSKIALHYSSSAMKTFAYAPLLKGFDYRESVYRKFYDAFRHYNVDVIDTAHSLDGYDVVISPFLATVDENGLKERIIEWVKAGGTWIVGPMSDIMTEYASKYTDAPYSFLEEFAGVYTKYQLPVGNDVFCAKGQEGDVFPLADCYDAYELRGARSLAVYDGDEFGGLSVVTEREIGKGKVILLGSVVPHAQLRALAGKLPIAEASNNVVLTERSGGQNGIIAIETENRHGSVVLGGKYRDLLSGSVMEGKVNLAPYGVLVLKEEE